MATLFISDLHLQGGGHPAGGLFHRFLAERAVDAEALYILGDLFEVWLGDDLILPEHQAIITALRTLTDRGIPVFVMHGNRDFLLGADFASLTGCRLLPEPAVIDLYGTPTLLLHGDSLCTDDTAYQAMRAQLRQPAWIAWFLAQPGEERIRLARELRARSRDEVGRKDAYTMDANPQAITAAVREHHAARLIHGHTHRPGSDTLTVDDRTVERFVLGAWEETGSMLVCDAGGCRLMPFP